MRDLNQSSGVAENWEFIAMFLAWQRKVERVLETECGTTLLRFWVILCMNRRSNINVKQITDLLELKYTTVAEAVSALERQGALTKLQTDEDRRMTLVSVTDQGVKLFREWDAVLVNLALQAWEDFSVEKRKQALYQFYVVGKSVDKSREFDGIVRGDTAFFISCAQITIDFQRLCTGIPTSTTQAILLMLLNARGSMQPKDIAHCIAKPPNSVSKMLRESCDKKLVQLQQGPSKRETTVHLTDKGSELSRTLESMTTDMLENRFGSDRDTTQSLRRTARYLMNKLREQA